MNTTQKEDLTNRINDYLDGKSCVKSNNYLDNVVKAGHTLYWRQLIPIVGNLRGIKPIEIACQKDFMSNIYLISLKHPNYKNYEKIIVDFSDSKKEAEEIFYDILNIVNNNQLPKIIHEKPIGEIELLLKDIHPELFAHKFT